MFEQPQVNRYLISSITKLLHELLHKLTNDLRLWILGNQEILENCQIWVETQPSVTSFFQKLNFDNSCQKPRKTRQQIFEVLSSFTGFLYFVPNVFSRIVVRTLVSLLMSILSTSAFSAIKSVLATKLAISMAVAFSSFFQYHNLTSLILLSLYL